MTPQDIVVFYKTGEAAFDLWNEIWHGRKDYLGSVMLQDSSSRLWKVKVRFTGYRRRYLKIRLVSNTSRKLRASADGYKPGEYLCITPNEWQVFACLAEGKHDSELHACAQSILSRLVDAPLMLGR